MPGRCGVYLMVNASPAGSRSPRFDTGGGPAGDVDAAAVSVATGRARPALTADGQVVPDEAVLHRQHATGVDGPAVRETPNPTTGCSGGGILLEGYARQGQGARVVDR